MNIGKYLERLHYTGSLEPTPELLGALQEAHLLNIPFENLDIQYGVPIELDIERIYQKIVPGRRGGFCYELNGLFYELLGSLGFNVRRISARVFDKVKGYGPEYDHLAIIAEIDGNSYLSDVGFGEFAFRPIKMEPGLLQKDPRGDFIILEYENDYYQVGRSVNNITTPEYIFKTTSRELAEFSAMCHYHQTNPASHFTQNLVVSRPVAGGRITLTRDNLKITREGRVSETSLDSKEMFRSMLLKYFEIELPVEQVK